MRAWIAPFGRTTCEEPKLPVALSRAHRRERWAAALGAALLASLLLLSGVGAIVENRLGEVRAQLLDRAPTGEIAIVAIDAKSIAALNNWPWSRRYHAELVNRLHEAGASMIAFDVDLSAQSDAAGDRAFAQALRTSQPVVLPIFQQRASDDPGQRAMIKNRPAAQFSAAWVGGVNILPGRDGVVRDFPAATMINGQIQPSMAVLLSDNDNLGDRAFIPDWSIDVTRIPRFSFIDVLDGHVSRASIAGKRIIVGATAIELGDRYTIPRFGTVPGVVIQALAAESLLQHRTLTRTGLLPMLMGLCLVMLLVGCAYRKFSRTFPIAVATMFAILLAGPVLIQSRWPLSVDTAALLLAAMIGTGLRIVVEARHRIRLNALRDVETHLPNEAALAAAVKEGSGANLSVTAASIDRFDQIRTALGAAAAAELIEEAARRIASAADVQVYRIAADTLAWLTSEDDAEAIAAAVAERLVDPIATASGSVDVRLTFGIAGGSEDPASLTQSALTAVSSARATGFRSHWFEGMGARERRDLSIMGDLRRGLASGQLFVAYQPKLDLRTGDVSHAEALVRWQHPTEGLIPPDRFLPLAEETGIVRELTRFVLGRVIADCSDLSRNGCKPCISINVSAHDICEPEFAGELIEAVSQSGLDPRQLTLEITESAIIRSRETALQVLHALHQHGILLSIDDYGTGQSTLSYLKALPVDELKIDKSFVTSICTNVNDRIMVRSTIEMAHELGLSVVAEGVEDAATVNLLKRLDCDFVQGFAIGKASALEQLWPAARKTDKAA